MQMLYIYTCIYFLRVISCLDLFYIFFFFFGYINFKGFFCTLCFLGFFFVHFIFIVLYLRIKIVNMCTHIYFFLYWSGSDAKIMLRLFWCLTLSTTSYLLLYVFVFVIFLLFSVVVVFIAFTVFIVINFAYIYI